MEEGVSHEQVRKDIKEATVNGLTDADFPDVTTGCDGRNYPARRPDLPKDWNAIVTRDKEHLRQRFTRYPRKMLEEMARFILEELCERPHVPRE